MRLVGWDIGWLELLAFADDARAERNSASAPKSSSSILAMGVVEKTIFLKMTVYAIIRSWLR